MPYIDINKLKKDVINSWNNDKHCTAEASQIHGQEHRHLMLIVERQPTADVVPRAAVEQLQLKYGLAVAEREANVKGFTEQLAKAKADTAREIFAEIDNSIGIGHDILDVFDILDELKKKYTEGEQ